jgi:hypothetical protein
MKRVAERNPQQAWALSKPGRRPRRHRRHRGRACKPSKQIGANVLAACFIIDLPDLGGAEKIRNLGVPVRTLVSFEGH